MQAQAAPLFNKAHALIKSGEWAAALAQVDACLAAAKPAILDRSATLATVPAPAFIAC